MTCYVIHWVLGQNPLQANLGDQIQCLLQLFRRRNSCSYPDKLIIPTIEAAFFVTSLVTGLIIENSLKCRDNFLNILVI